MTSASPPPRHERTRHLAARLAALAGVVLALAGMGSTRSGAAGILPGTNPPSNVAATPDFLATGACAGLPGAWRCDNPCVTTQLAFPAFSDAPRCVAYVALAIDAARAREGVGTLVLPADWSALTAREQRFVLADLDRTARGLPPYLGLNAALSAEAQHAAGAGADPGLAPGFAVGVNRAGALRVGGAWPSFDAVGMATPCRAPGARPLGGLACHTTFTTGRHPAGSPDKEER